MASQEQVVGEFVSRQEGVLVGTFREVESGGKTDQERPALAEALAAAKKLKATLIVAKLDRLSRNAEFLLRLQNSNVSFVCCDCPNVDRFTVGILALVAQRERELIAERTKAALHAAKRRGRVLGTRNPELQVKRMNESCRRLKESFVAQIHPVIAEIQESGVRTLQGIADCLNRRGIRSRSGGLWHPSTVRRICRQA
jgi:DNA invertase Pin-like site-specific DNA recombinase